MLDDFPVIICANTAAAEPCRKIKVHCVLVKYQPYMQDFLLPRVGLLYNCLS